MQNRLILSLSFLIFFSGLFFLRYQQTRINLPEGPVAFEAVLFEEPKISGQSQYFTLNNFKIQTRAFPEFHFGDFLSVQGEALEGKLNFPKIEKKDESHLTSLTNEGLGIFVGLRRSLTAVINKNLSEPQASLLAGILLGVDQLSFEFKKSLISTGTIHTVVVSGQNISLVAGFFLSLCGLIKRRQAQILAISAIIFYVFLVGLEPPVIRAAIMAFMAFGAGFWGRQKHGLWALGISAMTMILIDPALVWNLSFQLSFLATLGILVLSPQICSWFSFLPGILREAWAVTLSAWVMTAPIIAYNFGNVSLVAPMANLAVGWVILPSMILGTISLILSWLPVVSSLIFWILYAILTYFAQMINLFSQLFSYNLNQVKIDIIWTISLYFVIFGGVGWIYYRGAKTL